jgi:hypothetical protein
MEGSSGPAGSGGPGADDLGAFAVFDPHAGDARARGFDPRAAGNPPSTDSPSIMTHEAVDRIVEDRWRKQQGSSAAREKPDPWPIIERALPRIAATIRDHGGKRALDDPFSKLVVDDRGTRQGFPLAVLSAIMEVARLHAAQRRFSRPICPWETDVRESKWWNRG